MTTEFCVDVAEVARSATQAIEPYVDGLRVWRRETSGAGEPVNLPRLTVAGRDIVLEPGLWSEVDRYIERPDDHGQDDPAWLVTYGVALTVKSLSDLQSLQKADPQSVRREYDGRAQMMLNSALGRSLVRRTQQSIDRLLAGGDPARARSLGEFQRQLRGVHLEVRAALKELDGVEVLPRETDLLEVLETLSPELPALAEADRVEADPKRAVDADRRRAVLPTRSRVSARTEGPGDPTAVAEPGRLLGILLLIALAARVALFPLPHGLATDLPAAPFAGAALPAAVVAIESRPPALFVTVDGSSWDASGPAARESLVSDTVRALGGEWPAKAIFLRPGRVPVAEWSAAGGARLIDPEPAGSVSGIGAAHEQ